MSTSSEEPEADRRLIWAQRAVWTVLLAGVLAFLVQGADNPPDPVLVPTGDSSTTTSPGPELADGGLAVASPPVTGPSTTVVTAPPTSAPSATTAARAAGSSRQSPGTATATGEAPPEVPPSSATTTVVRRPLPGFGETAFRVTDAGGKVVDGMALLADDAEARRQGLREQTDLRGYDAMVFRFPKPSTGAFTMRDTRIPLSIAFFDLYGRFVSSTDMEPCPDQVLRCPSYVAEGPYLHAIEVIQGDLARLGIGPRSVLSFPSS